MKDSLDSFQLMIITLDSFASNPRHMIDPLDLFSVLTLSGAVMATAR